MSYGFVQFYILYYWYYSKASFKATYKKSKHPPTNYLSENIINKSVCISMFIKLALAAFIFFNNFNLNLNKFSKNYIFSLFIK